MFFRSLFWSNFRPFWLHFWTLWVTFWPMFWYFSPKPWFSPDTMFYNDFEWFLRSVGGSGRLRRILFPTFFCFICWPNFWSIFGPFWLPLGSYFGPFWRLKILKVCGADPSEGPQGTNPPKKSPNDPPRCPKWPPRLPKWIKKLPKWPPKAPKMNQKAPKMTPQGSKNDPGRDPKRHPNGFQGRPHDPTNAPKIHTANPPSIWCCGGLVGFASAYRITRHRTNWHQTASAGVAKRLQFVLRSAGPRSPTQVMVLQKTQQCGVTIIQKNKNLI